jgi:hypothetical protein
MKGKRNIEIVRRTAVFLIPSSLTLFSNTILISPLFRHRTPNPSFPPFTREEFPLFGKEGTGEIL